MSVPTPNPTFIGFSRLTSDGSLTFRMYPDDQSRVFDFPRLPHYPQMYGSIHGIICFSNREDIYLFNPITLEVYHLPPSILPKVRSGPNNELYAFTLAVGFGYDPKSKDYKVVRVVSYNRYPIRVEIYYLSTGRWKEIDLTCVFTAYIYRTHMFHEGFYYWWTAIEGKEYLQTFDMTTEVFSVIPLPDSFEYLESGFYRRLGVWNGSIVIFHYPDEKTLDIWGMENHVSGRVLWSKLLTCCPLPRIYRPLLFVNSDELLIESEICQVFSYNLTTQKLTNVSMEGFEEKRDFDCFAFEKTKLSIKGQWKGAGSSIM